MNLVKDRLKCDLSFTTMPLTHLLCIKFISAPNAIAYFDKFQHNTLILFPLKGF